MELDWHYPLLAHREILPQRKTWSLSVSEMVRAASLPVIDHAMVPSLQLPGFRIINNQLIRKNESGLKFDATASYQHECRHDDRAGHDPLASLVARAVMNGVACSSLQSPLEIRHGQPPQTLRAVVFFTVRSTSVDWVRMTPGSFIRISV
jgi:hypothetical protein